MRKVTSVLIAGGLLAFAEVAPAQYVLRSSTINGGGARLTSAGYIQAGSFGQSTIGALAGVGYRARIGFWSPAYFIPVGIGGGTPGSPRLPGATALAQNFPNPFNPATEIRFEIASSRDTPGSPRPLPCSLKVYDLKGRLVRTLVTGARSPGRYVAHWDGRDEMGRAVASGVYLYRLQAGGDQATRRMVLLK